MSCRLGGRDKWGELDRENQVRAELEKRAGIPIDDCLWADFKGQWPSWLDIAGEDWEDAVSLLRRLARERTPQAVGAEQVESVGQRLVGCTLSLRRDLTGIAEGWRLAEFGDPAPPFDSLADAQAWIIDIAEGELEAFRASKQAHSEWKTLSWSGGDGAYSWCIVAPGGRLDALRLLSERVAPELVTSASDVTSLVLLGSMPFLRPVTIAWSWPLGGPVSVTSTVDPTWERHVPPGFCESRRKYYMALLSGHAPRKQLSLKALANDLDLVDQLRRLSGVSHEERWREWGANHPTDHEYSVDAHRRAGERACRRLTGLQLLNQGEP